MVAITEGREACRGEKKLKDRLLAAMKCLKNHWLVTNEDERLRLAVCATMLESNEEDVKILQDEWKALRALLDILSGKGGSAGDIKIPEKSVGIVQMWKEMK
jgi:hypothetical protein